MNALFRFRTGQLLMHRVIMLVKLLLRGEGIRRKSFLVRYACYRNIQRYSLSIPLDGVFYMMLHFRVGEHCEGTSQLTLSLLGLMGHTSD